MRGPLQAKLSDVTAQRSIQEPRLPAHISVLDDLPPSDEDQYSDDSMSDHKDFEDLGDNALAQRYQMLEAEVDAWTPAKMYRMGSLGPFIWAVLRDSPEKFNGYMDAMISSGQSITRRLFDSTPCLLFLRSSISKTRMTCERLRALKRWNSTEENMRMW